MQMSPALIEIKAALDQAQGPDDASSANVAAQHGTQDAEEQ